MTLVGKTRSNVVVASRFFPWSFYSRKKKVDYHSSTRNEIQAPGTTFSKFSDEVRPEGGHENSWKKTAADVRPSTFSCFFFFVGSATQVYDHRPLDLNVPCLIDGRFCPHPVELLRADYVSRVGTPRLCLEIGPGFVSNTCSVIPCRHVTGHGGFFFPPPRRMFGRVFKRCLGLKASQISGQKLKQKTHVPFSEESIGLKHAVYAVQVQNT